MRLRQSKVRCGYSATVWCRWRANGCFAEGYEICPRARSRSLRQLDAMRGRSSGNTSESPKRRCPFHGWFREARSRCSFWQCFLLRHFVRFAAERCRAFPLRQVRTMPRRQEIRIRTAAHLQMAQQPAPLDALESHQPRFPITVKISKRAAVKASPRKPKYRTHQPRASFRRGSTLSTAATARGSLRSLKKIIPLAQRSSTEKCASAT